MATSLKFFSVGGERPELPKVGSLDSLGRETGAMTMPILIRNLWLALISLALSAGALAQDSQNAKTPDPAQPAGNSSVTGRAIYEDTGEPATRVRVQLIASQAIANPPRRLRIPTSITNDNGEFHLRRVDAGEYYVVGRPMDEHGPSAQIFPILNPSDDSAVKKAKLEEFKKAHVRIAVDGEHNVEIILRVTNPHFGSISGRILDPMGQPAVSASVILISKTKQQFAASVRTDDKGHYIFRGLSAGEYIVSANPPAKRNEEPGQPRNLEGVAGATFFPSTLKLQDSPPIVVLADRDTGNIEVTLLGRSLHRISGVVRMQSDSRPVTNAQLRLSVRQLADQSPETPRNRMDAAMSIYLSTSDKTGNWSIANVPDGSYRLFIESHWNRQMGPPFVQKEMDLVVEGADLENLSIEVSQGSRISGVVTLEGANPSPPQSISVAAHRVRENAISTVNLDRPGEFTLDAVPAGEITLSAFTIPQLTFYVKSIDAKELDLLRNTLTIAEGEHLKDVRIVISADVSVVTGRVLSQTHNKPIAGANVLIHRISNDKLRLFGGTLSSETDSAGNFKLSAAPGIYVIVAWRNSDGPSAFAEAMNRATLEKESNLTLAPRDTKRVDVRIP